MTSRPFIVGDRLISLLSDLYAPGADGNDVPIVLGPAETVVFRMVATNGTVKVNNQAATIISRGDAIPGTPARVQYDWASADVDTAGTYEAWFIRQSAGQTEHFPTPNNPAQKLKIIFTADT